MSGSHLILLKSHFKGKSQLLSTGMEKEWSHLMTMREQYKLIISALFS